MKIIYHCYGGAHSSVTAAAIHLGWLPTNRIPEAEELMRLPYFDRPVAEDHGRIRLMGRDECGHDVYVLGRRKAAQIVENTARGLMDLYGIPQHEIQLINVMPYVNWKMMLGGYNSRKMGWVRWGRPTIISGVRYSYWKFVNLVHRVKTVNENEGG